MFTTNSGRFISYYGREHTLDIQRQDGNNPTISTIDQLFNVLLNVFVQLLVRGVPCKQLFYLIGMWYKKDVNCFFTF